MVRFLTRHAALAMAAGVFAGLALPRLAAALHGWIGPLVVVILTAALLRLDGALLRAYLRRPALPVLAIAWLTLGLPLMVWILIRLLAPPPPIAEALLLNAVTPPVMGSPALALLLGLDAELAALATFVCTLLFPACLGLILASGALAAGAAPRFAEVAPTVLVLVGLPFAISLSVRATVSRPLLQRWAPRFDAAGVAALIGMAIALMHGANLVLHDDPRAALPPFAASLAFNLAGLGLTALLFRRLGRARALCLGLMAGNRNLALTLGAMAAAGIPGFAAYVAFAQLPIYLTPMALARLTGRKRA